MSTLNAILFERLTKSKIEYIAHSAIGEDCVRVDFAGFFEGRKVIWNATIVALNAQKVSNVPQYIEIKEFENEDFQALSVETGLKVNLIDEPTIIKVIKMIRQYKNLQRGRHEFMGTSK